MYRSNLPPICYKSIDYPPRIILHDSPIIMPVIIMIMWDVAIWRIYGLVAAIGPRNLVEVPLGFYFCAAYSCRNKLCRSAFIC